MGGCSGGGDRQGGLTPGYRLCERFAFFSCPDNSMSSLAKPTENVEEAKKNVQYLYCVPKSGTGVPHSRTLARLPGRSLLFGA